VQAAPGRDELVLPVTRQRRPPGAFEDVLRRSSVAAPNDRSIDSAAMQRQPIRSFHARHGRARPQQRAILDSLWSQYGANFPDDHNEPDLPRIDSLDGSGGCLDRLFTPELPVVLEIGFGMGEATAAMAGHDPKLGVLAIDVHRPGIVRLLSLIDEAHLTNVRVARGDASDLLTRGIPQSSLAGTRIFFPDPWPKARHHKRRLIKPDFVALLVSRLGPVGFVHLATDWPDYADQMRSVLDTEPRLVHADINLRAPSLQRVETAYERIGRAKGHDVTDLIYERR